MSNLILHDPQRIVVIHEAPIARAPYVEVIEEGVILPEPPRPVRMPAPEYPQTYEGFTYALLGSWHTQLLLVVASVFVVLIAAGLV